MALYFFGETKKKNSLDIQCRIRIPFEATVLVLGSSIWLLRFYTNWWFLHSYTWEEDFQSVCLSVPLLNFQTLSIKRWGKVAHGFNYLKSTPSYDACIIISQIGVLLSWRRRFYWVSLYISMLSFVFLFELQYWSTGHGLKKIKLPYIFII